MYCTGVLQNWDERQATHATDTNRYVWKGIVRSRSEGVFIIHFQIVLLLRCAWIIMTCVMLGRWHKLAHWHGVGSGYKLQQRRSDT